MNEPAKKLADFVVWQTTFVAFRGQQAAGGLFQGDSEFLNPESLIPGQLQGPLIPQFFAR